MLNAMDFDEPMEDITCCDCRGFVRADDPAEYVLLADGTLTSICLECAAKRRAAAQTRMNEAAKWN